MTSEISFLAVLLRLMSFLVPSLGALQADNAGVARRFSIMATVILECHGSHPVISIEAMAFFEVLAAHQQLLPPPSTHIEYAENALFSCIPFVLQTLTPDRLGMYGRGTWQGRYFSSPASMRSTVYLVKVLSHNKISVAEWTDMKIVSLLIASLETTCGSRFFTGANLVRSLASPRDSEVHFAEGVALEGEIFSVVRTMLFLERSFHKFETERLVRWILFARAVLASAATAPAAGDDTPEFSCAGVVQSALARASSDAMAVHAVANPTRWQVKCLAAQLATIALDELVDIAEENCPNAIDHFDFMAADRTCAKLCRKATESGGKKPQTHLVFHLGDVLSAACMSSIATLDQAELQTLQGSSIRLLRKLVVCFARITDPEEPGVSILEQHATQIFSSVKHALGAPDDSETEASLRLFQAGCEAIQSMVEHEMTTDVVVLKRLIRPTLPPNNDIPFFGYTEGYPPTLLAVGEGRDHLNIRVSLLSRICRVWTAGSLLLGNSDEHPEYLRQAAADLVKNDTDMAVHSAAIAIDGARLLLRSKLSLIGRPLSDDDARRGVSSECGFLYSNADDIDDNVKSALVTVWSSCASASMRPLLEYASRDEGDDKKREQCTVWVQKLIPLLFAGTKDAMSMSGPSSSGSGSEFDWTKGIDGTAIQVNCFRGVASLVRDAPSSLWDSGWNDDLEHIVDMILDKVFMPLLTAIEPRDEGSSKAMFDERVVKESCNLLRELATSRSDAVRKDSALLLTVLTPLDLLQSGTVPFEDNGCETIISSCLEAAGSLISQPTTGDSLVKSMLQLVLKTVFQTEKLYPDKVKDSAKVLLRACLGHSAIPLKEQQIIASDVASEGDWEMWTVLCLIEDGRAIAPSLETVQKVLRDDDDSSSQLAFLAALSSVTQSATIPSPLLGRIFGGVGAEVLTTLYQYGTLQVPNAARPHRQTMCAQAMKLTLIGYQQITSDESDDQHVGAFLSILFATLLAILRFNGLPNHPSPQADGDEALGRMSAQAILHVARTTPVAFKASMASLSDHDRGLLEFAVRAEMTGYVVQGQVAAPKKLNVKSFQK